jgi:hypothetical protein
MSCIFVCVYMRHNTQYPYRSGTTHVRDPYEARNTGRQEASEQGWVWVFCNLGLCLAACVLSKCELLPWQTEPRRVHWTAAALANRITACTVDINRAS